MPRDGATQTRTFTYDTTTQSRLLSATNPENGTVSYTYNADGTTATKTDAKGIKTEFSYDAYKRVLQMRKLTQVSSVWTEDRCQRTDYFYDEGGGTNNGRLTRVKWNWMLNESNVEVPCAVAGGFTEQYSYNSAGRILSKNLTLTKSSNGNTGSASLAASWTYNNEGQVTNVMYPNRFEGLFQSQRLVTHGYDSMARLNSVQTKLATENQQNPAWQSVISGVQFNAFGAVTSLNHLGVTESRTYNILGQMTRMTKGSLIDVEYRFSATANDGKILSQKNWLSGEDVTYQYDELERLISASTTAGTSWGLSWAYDGFGNRLLQTVTQGTGPASVTLVNGNTNRISSAGYAYDSNGNMTQMPKGSGSMTLDYDLSNRVSGVSHPDGAEQYRYAPDNRRVWRSAGRTACYASRGNDQEGYWSGSGEGATEQVILYSPGGQKMGAYCLSFSANLQYFAVTASEENVYYGGRLVGKRLVSVTNSNNGLVSDFTADRLQSKGNGSNYYPYGESNTSNSGDDREGFATYTRDEKSGLDYADQRWYASGVGRFSSPDPYQASAGPSDPASWNRFTYVRGEPVGRYDPVGLADCVPTQPCNITVTAPAPPDIPSGPGGVNSPTLEAQPPQDQIPHKLPSGFESRDAVTKSFRSIAASAVNNLAADCKSLFQSITANPAAIGPQWSLLQALEAAASNTYFYNLDGTESSLTFHNITGLGDKSASPMISTLFVAGAAGTTLTARYDGRPDQAIGHVIFGPSFYGQNSSGRDAIMIHELLHVTLPTDSHEQMFTRFGLSSAVVAALSVGTDGKPADPLTSFLQRGCKR